MRNCISSEATQKFISTVWCMNINKPFNDGAKRFFRYDALCYDAVLCYVSNIGNKTWYRSYLSNIRNVI
jgi:hypothetical protein